MPIGPRRRRHFCRWPPPPSTSLRVFVISLLALAAAALVAGQSSRDSARLYETLLSDYNKLVRPVFNNSETLVVRFKLKLSQLLDVVSASGALAAISNAFFSTRKIK